MLFWTKALAAAVVACAAAPAFAEAPVERMVLAQSTAESGAMGAEKACLAEAVYSEANGEPLSGRIAVAHVILNRARSGSFPRTVCGVVNQKGQFTYRRGRIRTDAKGWLEARAVATLALAGRVADFSRSALYFHSIRVKPNWGSAARPVTRIGAHVFYAAR